MESYSSFSKKSLCISGAGILGLSLMLMVLVLTGQAGLMDDWAAQFVDGSGEGMHQFFSALTPLGSSKVLGPVALLFVTLIGIVKKDWIQAGMMFIGVLVGYGFNIVLKSMVARERPVINEGVEGFSFPSGHAMVSLICAVLAFYFLSRKARSKVMVATSSVVGFTLVFLIGISRVFEGAHYFSDVLAGFTFGFVFAGVWIVMYEWMEKRTNLRLEAEEKTTRSMF
ncbi:phosphatase PAP2 family protein [Pontibacillus sp. ALD_SL1]|uniref:phosphatase PAP2 family protein n=1 Tax=Pontibacillus sp. ALD_SL1 TaxID=2777185 RepID=UPI001A96830E|nr:phosphatase PAP2 family protein [Pontibacillus sp. ALD_SL1]QST00733.1 phosphatase PAP2 family protein [Pontibacillus sp. ALD_SL1]